MRRKLRTDRRLWRVFTVAAFARLGFVSLMPQGVEHKISPTYLWGVVAAAWTYMPWGDVAGMIVVYSALLAIPAAVIGWVAQAIVVAVQHALTDVNAPRKDAPTA